MASIPLDGELGDPGLTSEDVSLQLFKNVLRWWILAEFGVRVVRVHVVADANELGAFKRARQQNHRHAHHVRRRNQLGVGRVRLEHEHVLAGLYVADQHGVEDLVAFGVLGGTDVDEFPFEIAGQFETLERDLKLKRIEEATRIVEYDDVGDANASHLFESLCASCFSNNKP